MPISDLNAGTGNGFSQTIMDFPVYWRNGTWNQTTSPNWPYSDKSLVGNSGSSPTLYIRNVIPGDPGGIIAFSSRVNSYYGGTYGGIGARSLISNVVERPEGSVSSSTIATPYGGRDVWVRYPESSYAGGSGGYNFLMRFKDYKEGLDYGLGANYSGKHYTTIARLQYFNGFVFDTSKDRGNMLTVKCEFHPPFDQKMKLTNRAISGGNNLGDQRNYTITTRANNYYVECFGNVDYYGDIAGTPSGYIHWSASGGKWQADPNDDNNFTPAGDSYPEVTIDSVRWIPPRLNSGETQTFTISQRVDRHGYNKTITGTVTVKGSGGGGESGVSNPTSKASYGLVVLAPDQSVRFQSSSFDSLARKVATRSINKSFNGVAGGTYTLSTPGCNNSNAIAVAAEDTTGQGQSFSTKDDLAPAMSFSGGNLTIKAPYCGHRVTACRVKGASQVSSPSNYGIKLYDSSGNIILDDGELALGVAEKISFSENEWNTYLDYSELIVNTSKSYSVAPIVAIRTDKNLWVCKPKMGSKNYQAGVYDKVTVSAAGRVSSNGEILILTSDADSTNVIQYNDTYGARVWDQNKKIVFDTNKAIAAVTDLIDVDRFTTGTNRTVDNIASGLDGVTSFNLNAETPNQIVTVTGINADPARDYLCFNGTVGTVVRAGGYLGVDLWRLQARFRPSSKGSSPAIELTMDYGGNGLLNRASTHPEGNLIIIRSNI